MKLMPREVCGINQSDWIDSEIQAVCTYVQRLRDGQDGREPSWEAGCIPGKCKADGGRWLSVLFVRKWGMVD